MNKNQKSKIKNQNKRVGISIYILISFIITYCLLFLFSAPAALATDSSVNYAQTAVNTAGPGSGTWNNLGNITTDDDQYVNVGTNNVCSEYLDVTNFGFNIPDTATIDGIKVEVARKGSSFSGGTVSTTVSKLLKNGVMQSTDKSDPGTQWPTTESYVTYGSLTDNWGDNTWTGADINDPDFGLRLEICDWDTFGNGYVDTVRITVSYTSLANFPSSSSFALQQYGFGAGGIATSSSTNYMFQGILGEIESASPSSANFRLGPGLTYTLEPNIPAAPSLTNPSSYYNKLHIIIDDGGNPTDTTFVIQISSGSATFSSNVFYVQADNTISLSPIWQTYASWGSGTGFNIIGLSPGTTYYARVAARRGTFQQGAFGAIAFATTTNPTLTFDLDTTTQSVPPFSVAIGNLTAGSVTTSTDKVTATITTNAASGALVYLTGSNNGLKTAVAGNYTISSVTNNLTSVSEGYGARGTTVTQSSGGPMTLVSPYNGSGENVGIIDTTKRLLSDSTSAPVTSGEVSFELKAKASDTTPSAFDYTDTLTVIGTGSF